MHQSGETPGQGGHLRPGCRLLTRTGSAGHLDFGLGASRTICCMSPLVCGVLCEPPEPTKTAVQITTPAQRATHTRLAPPHTPLAGQSGKASWGRRALAEKCELRKDWGGGSPGKCWLRRQSHLLKICSGKMLCSFRWFKFHVVSRRFIFPS